MDFVYKAYARKLALPRFGVHKIMNGFKLFNGRIF